VSNFYTNKSVEIPTTRRILPNWV